MLARERRALGRALMHVTQAAAHRVARIAERAAFRDPHVLTGPAAQALDLLRARLQRAIPERLARDTTRLEVARRRLATVGPHLTARPEAALRLQAARLDDLSPLRILARGYAAAFAEDGTTVVRSVRQVSPGDRLVVRVADGRIGCAVGDIETEER